MLLGVVSLAMGIVFVQQGFSKQNWIQNSMKQEQITLGIESGDVEEGEVIDTSKEAQVAGDTVREHRHGIAPTYGDLLGGEKFNPTESRQLSYAQALNLENYLYLAVATFGLINVVLASGAFMIVNSLALGATGFSLYSIAKTA
jgi:hypothetical protein